MKKIILILFLLQSVAILAKPNLLIITIDGLRWQEVFHGADYELTQSKKFVKNSKLLLSKYWLKDQDQRKRKLMPFVWNTIASKGVIIGNRDIGSLMSVSNPWYFSYPGYNEIFTGIADPAIDSNKKKPNPNVSFLEWLNNKAEYGHKLAAFASWDVFPYIFNTARSHLLVNAGFDSAKDENTEGYKVSKDIEILNQLQRELPSPWETVRLDAFTFHFALDYLKKVQPRVLAISFGETDDFAHDGKYDQYLNSVHRTDNFIKDIWRQIQAIPKYKNNTVLIITTDHGRGRTAKDWQHHASKKATQGYLDSLKKFPEGILGSNEVWMMAIGPGVSTEGEVKTKVEVKQKQIAATVLTLLGEDPKKFNASSAKPIKEILR